MEILENKSVEELSEYLYNLTKDMDFLDNEETKEKELEDIKNFLYHLKTISKNEYNEKYFKTFWNLLQLI